MISQILIATLTFAGSAIAFWISARLRSDVKKSRNWPTVSGKIVERGIEAMQTDGRSFTPRVRYCYAVAGKEYAGQQLYRTGRVGSTKQPAQRLADGLPDHIPVHYNPENPSEAFLLTNPSRIFWIAAAFGVGAFIWGVLQVLTLVVQ
ncbi:MAG TPA: DUF3592 domain-containing protein [Bryobacteraceae bacterium]|nr:DUF3592 domain-containing protein [Bryobacteraceae bacterium]